MMQASVQICPKPCRCVDILLKQAALSSVPQLPSIQGGHQVPLGSAGL